MMGQSDGFTLVKGISSYGLKQMKKRANVFDDFSNVSEMTKTNTSRFAKKSRGN